MIDKIKNSNTNINNIRIVLPSSKATSKPRSEGLEDASKRLSGLQNKASSSGVQPNISVGGPTIMFPERGGVSTSSPILATARPFPEVVGRPVRRQPEEPVQNPYEATSVFNDGDTAFTTRYMPNLTESAKQELRPDFTYADLEKKYEDPYGIKPLYQALYDERDPLVKEEIRRMKTGDFVNPDAEATNPNDQRFFRSPLHANTGYTSTDINEPVSPLRTEPEDFVGSVSSTRSRFRPPPPRDPQPETLAPSVNEAPSVNVEEITQKPKRRYVKKTDEQRIQEKEAEELKREAKEKKEARKQNTSIQNYFGPKSSEGYGPKKGGGGGGGFEL